MRDKARELPAVYTAEAHMCAYGMQSKDKHRPGYGKKPTRFLANSIYVGEGIGQEMPWQQQACTPHGGKGQGGGNISLITLSNDLSSDH